MDQLRHHFPSLFGTTTIHATATHHDSQLGCVLLYFYWFRHLSHTVAIEGIIDEKFADNLTPIDDEDSSLTTPTKPTTEEDTPNHEDTNNNRKRTHYEAVSIRE